MSAAAAPPETVIWHDLECGSYRADLPLWRELAAASPGPVLDVGAGTGRVALDLARRGHRVIALDRDPELLEALGERARGLPVRAVRADARAFSLDEPVGLCLAPMQTIQLLADATERASFLRCARAHLRPGGRLACALADAAEGVVVGPWAAPPAPDRGEIGGTWYESQPVGLRDDGDGLVIERLRTTYRPDGRRTVAGDAVRLARLSASRLGREGERAGLRAEPTRLVAPTEEHVGSEVAVLRA